MALTTLQLTGLKTTNSALAYLHHNNYIASPLAKFKPGHMAKPSTKIILYIRHTFLHVVVIIVVVLFLTSHSLMLLSSLLLLLLLLPSCSNIILLLEQMNHQSPFYHHCSGFQFSLHNNTYTLAKFVIIIIGLQVL